LTEELGDGILEGLFFPIFNKLDNLSLSHISKFSARDRLVRRKSFIRYWRAL
jgi:hypothetical protein